MKLLSNLSLALALGSTVFSGTLRAQAAPAHVSASVKLESSTDYKKIAGSSGKSKEQTRQLEITLDNRETREITGISVKWTIYARSMDGTKLKTAAEGTEHASIPALQSVTLKSPVVTIKGTPKHAVAKKGKNQAKAQTADKSVAAEGEEYYGYAVRVFEGSALIDESYSQPSLKAGK